MNITRRAALTGAAAIAVTGAVPIAAVPTAVAAQPQADVDLLARVEQFNDLYEASCSAWEKQHAHRARIKAMPECPDANDWHDPVDAPARHRAHTEFLDAHGFHAFYVEANNLNNQAGALAITIFQTPAKTVRGVAEKVRILYLARGHFDGEGDDDLESFQDAENSPWFGAVIADLERLVAGAA